jgi:uncharacterized protein (TIGR02145 family)
MLFINTKVSGQSSAYLSDYGESNGVKYITLQKGSGGQTVAEGSTATLKVALLNLGQSDNNDAGDLGYFYQWGRVADGHQQTSWSKNASHVNKIEPMNGTVTSAVIAYSAIAGGNATNAALNYQIAAKSDDVTPFHQVMSESDGYGKFISANSGVAAGNFQWYNPGYSLADQDSYLWGQSTQHVTNNRSPAKNGNDPCPSNWKVPSRWLFWDIFKGTGGSSDNPSTFNGAWTGAGIGTNNNWVWRPASSAYAVGGAVITNASGEKLFLPAAGNRNYSSGALNLIGIYGYYWSSTYGSAGYSDSLSFGSNYVGAGGNNDRKAGCFSVRCVAE